MRSPEKVLVIGGGVSGLSLAYYLDRAGIPFVLCEKDARLGGNIRTVQKGEFLYDTGPDSFLRTRPEGVELARALGLESEFVTTLPGASKVFVANEGRLLPMPEGMSLGVPTRVSSLLATELVSDVGKARALLEPFVPRGGEEDESILAFCERRVGTEMARKVMAPLLAGVFAGEASALSIRAAFPQLTTFEEKYGSLVVGMSGGKSLLEILRAPKKNHESPFVSFRRGLETIIRRLEEVIGPERILSETPVERIERDGTGYRVRVRGEELRFSDVALAGPPFSATTLLASLDSDFSRLLGGVAAGPTATVFFAFEERALERPLEGSGFIVPPGEGRILAATYVSSKWEGRAPRGKALVRAFLGGAREVGVSSLAVSDEELAKIARSELARFLGSMGQPLFTGVHRYPKGSPQPTVGHLKRLEELRLVLGRHPGLHLLGPGYGGVGIPDCVRQAKALAENLAAGKSS